MKINRIMLYNFNSYEGLNEFDFTSKDRNKNIILIGGKNGAGKTSLFTAIKIAFTSTSLYIQLYPFFFYSIVVFTICKYVAYM